MNPATVPAMSIKNVVETTARCGSHRHRPQLQEEEIRGGLFIYCIVGTTLLERSGTATRGDHAGDARAGTTLP